MITLTAVSTKWPKPKVGSRHTLATRILANDPRVKFQRHTNNTFKIHRIDLATRATSSGSASNQIFLIKLKVLVPLYRHTSNQFTLHRSDLANTSYPSGYAIETHRKTYRPGEILELN